MRKRYLIEIVDHDQLVVLCPDDLIREQTINSIGFGSKSITAKFLPHPDHVDRIVISKKIQNELMFPDFKLPLHLFFQNGTLFIGPLVGIFTAGFTPFPFKPIGERSTFFSKLLSVNKSVGALPFVFGEQHIDWDQALIKGHFFYENEWKMIDIPFPNVIYDRLPNRKSERNQTLKNVKERLQQDYLIPWYNPGFFNKLDVYERLQQELSVEKYLPETHPFSSFSQIETMLSKYGHVYVKPFNGSLGIGVHQILYDKQLGDYFCRYKDREGINRLRKFTSLEGLFRTVFTNKSLENMIVQQGIHLLKTANRSIDFRIHTNKDGNGNWHVTAIAAKIAGVGSVTTHIRSGGEIKTLKEIFSKTESRNITEKLTEAALLLSKALEKNMEGIIAEIGFDLGIDRNEDVWLFEANSKPGRSIFTHPDLKDFDLLTRRLTLAYAIFLTEQSFLHPEEIFK
ncbi:MAG TPA: YheC/YheD family protein [Bacillales bacterium]|nr:YheC/YheD family protein [Bacillales bacterium]